MNHRMLAMTAAILAGSLAAPGLRAQTAAELTIDVNQPKTTVSPMLYGLMTEEINYSYDGGLYAEMVRNRTFQDHDWAGVARWNIEHSGTSSATMEVDLADGPSAALDHSLAITVKQADSSNRAGVRNEGYWGMAVRPNTTYSGSFCNKYPQPVLRGGVCNRTNHHPFAHFYTAAAPGDPDLSK